MNLTFQTKEDSLKIIKTSYDEVLKLMPGTIQHEVSFFNLVSRLLHFFKKIFSQKTDYITNIYNVQYFLLNEHWIDFRTLRSLFPRLILLLNKLKFTDFSK